MITRLISNIKAYIEDYIIGLCKKMYVYIWLRIFSTLSSVYIFFTNIWFFKVLKRRKNLEKNLQNKKTFWPVKFPMFLDFLSKFFFVMKLDLKHREIALSILLTYTNPNGIRFGTKSIGNMHNPNLVRYNKIQKVI